MAQMRAAVRLITRSPRVISTHGTACIAGSCAVAMFPIMDRIAASHRGRQLTSEKWPLKPSYELGTFYILYLIFCNY